MILPILYGCMSAVKILRLSWRTKKSKFIHLLPKLLVVGGEFDLNLIFSKIRYNKLLCYSFAHINLFLARLRLFLF